MTDAEFKAYHQYAEQGTMPDNINPVFLFSTKNSSLLADIVSGKIDAQDLARRELRNRGLDDQGQWIGFNQPEKPATESLETMLDLYKFAVEVSDIKGIWKWHNALQPYWEKMTEDQKHTARHLATKANSIINQ